MNISLRHEKYDCKENQSVSAAATAAEKFNEIFKCINFSKNKYFYGEKSSIFQGLDIEQNILFKRIALRNQK